MQSRVKVLFPKRRLTKPFCRFHEAGWVCVREFWGCDHRHSSRRPGWANIAVGCNIFVLVVSGSSKLMRMTRTRGFALLTIALLWAVTPAVACVLPGATMTPAERECCHHMAEQCGSTRMPASHSCCKAQGPTNTVLPQALTAGPIRPLTIAVIPPVASLATLPAAQCAATFRFFMHHPQNHLPAVIPF